MLSAQQITINSLNFLCEAIFPSSIGSLLWRRPSEFNAIVIIEFWREATAASVPGFLCILVAVVQKTSLSYVPYSLTSTSTAPLCLGSIGVVLLFCKHHCLVDYSTISIVEFNVSLNCCSFELFQDDFKLKLQNSTQCGFFFVEFFFYPPSNPVHK